MTHFERPGEFYRTLGFLSKSGITLSHSLLLLSKTLDIPKEQEVCRQIYQRVLEGYSLSQSFRKAGFSKTLTAALEAAEMSGKIDEVLFWFGEFEEGNRELARDLTQALTQPLLALAFALLVILALPPLVLREQLLILAQNGTDLPTLSKGMLLFSAWMTHPGTLLLVPVVWLIFTRLYRYLKTDSGKRRTESLVCSLPVLGEITKRIAVSRTLFLFSLLLDSGIRIDRALGLAAEGSGNFLLADSAKYAIAELKNGRSLRRSFLTIDWFLPSSQNLLQAGQASGQISELARVAARLEEESFRQHLRNLATAAQPLVLVFVGVAVCLMALAILGPTMSLLDVA